MQPVTSLDALLTTEERAAIRAPIEHARTLPRRTFVSVEFFELEKCSLLRRSWFAAAFSAQLSGPGDILPLSVLGAPLLLTRDESGKAHAFHNVCPYDGCEVSTESQPGLTSIITPYHGWEYSLDGVLLGANYFDGTKAAAGVDLGALGSDLVPVGCTEWLGTLFVYIDGPPTAFEDDNRAVIEHCRVLDLERLTVGRDTAGEAQLSTLSIAANGKTVYENYSPNVYHESFVHAMYRKSPHSPRVDEHGNKTYTEINDPSGFLGLCYDNKIGGSFYGESKLPPLCNRDGSPNPRNTIANMYPNWVITILADCVRMAFFHPEGPEWGTQRLATFFDCDVAADPALVKDRERSARLGVIAREEDNRICESIQRARHATGVDSQFYSPFWDAMHYTLSNLILERLEQAQS